MSPVVRSRPIRTESTENVTDWAKRTGAIIFFTKAEYRGIGKQRPLILSDHVTY